MVGGGRPLALVVYREAASPEKQVNPVAELGTIKADISMLRQLLSCGLILIIGFLPCSLGAQESGVAVLYGIGSVFLNGAQGTNSSAITAGDVIQTSDTGAGNLSAPGSNVGIQSNTIARWQSGELALDRGSVFVATRAVFERLARDFKITPTSGDWTKYYVSRVSGTIQIIARKNKVTVSCGANSAGQARAAD
jgi:hypothetical protein